MGRTSGGGGHERMRMVLQGTFDVFGHVGAASRPRRRGMLLTRAPSRQGTTAVAHPARAPQTVSTPLPARTAVINNNSTKEQQHCRCLSAGMSIGDEEADGDGDVDQDNKAMSRTCKPHCPLPPAAVHQQNLQRRSGSSTTTTGC